MEEKSTGGSRIINWLAKLTSAAQAKFETTQKDQAKIFSDLVKSFSQTWGKAHDPSFENEIRARTILLKDVFVA
jgi:hypothetical protein